MDDKKRFPTLCSWCEHCVTGKDTGRRNPLTNPPSGYSTYCLKEHFDNDGKDNYADKTECPDYQADPSATLSVSHSMKSEQILLEVMVQFDRKNQFVEKVNSENDCKIINVLERISNELLHYIIECPSDKQEYIVDLAFMTFISNSKFQIYY